MTTDDVKPRGSANKQTIIAFCPLDSKPFVGEWNQHIEKLTDIICLTTSSWSEMADLMRQGPALITFQASLIGYDRVSITEFVSMLYTLIKCIPECKHTRIAAVISKDTNLTVIKLLQKTDVLGIIPCESMFGLEDYGKAISALVNGIPYWPKDIINKLPGNEIKRNYQSSQFNLTVRQSQVLELICNRGLSNKRIASALKITESTVKIHVSAILKTYGVRNRTQLAVAANSALKV